MSHTKTLNDHFDRSRPPLGKLLRAGLWLAPLLALLTLALVGCGSPSARLAADSKYYIKPTVAVLDFESTASPFARGIKWDLGNGLADVLTDELLKTERFHVLERPGINAVLAELRFQQGGATRDAGRKELGKLKNVEYLIKGKVTDFGHVSSNSFWATLDMLNVFGARHKAVMRMVFYVIEVESGEIVASRTVTGSVRAREGSVDAEYKGVGFGGSVFYKTPLGKATAKATEEAVEEICDAIAEQPWHPRIALVQDGKIIINGGADRGLQPGHFFRVQLPGQAIIDPDTGDLLDHLPGSQVGQLEVVEVHDRYSVARTVTRTNYEVGQRLAGVQPID